MSPGTPGTRHYTAYGMRVRSEIDLPLSPASAEGEPDVNVRIGAVPEALTAPRLARGIWEAAPGLFLLKVEGVARYLVREGRDIVVDPTGDAPDREAAQRVFLLGSALAACLRQRGILTLHASAVATERGAMLFAGHSGLGKSTLLATLVERGYAMLSDDVTGIVLHAAGRPTALPAFPGVRLWADAVEALGWQARSRERLREGLDKYVAPLDFFRDASLSVGAVFVLTNHIRDGIEIETLAPGDALELLGKRVYRARFARGLGQGREQFRALAALASGVPVVHVAKPMHGFPLETLTDRIEGCLREGWPARAERRAHRAGHPEAADLHDVEPGAGASTTSSQLPREMPGNGEPPRSIVWLASYPRSGNTWVRALLTNYCDGGGEPAAINALEGWSHLIRREVFDEHLGLSSSDMTPEEILRHRPRLHELLAAELPRPSFVKVHDAFVDLPGGPPLFPPPATLGAVYIVRNPLDVAVSYAHFWNWPVARAVAELNRPDAALSSRRRGIREVLPQMLSTWSGHVASWVDQRELPVHVMRYEDLLADPEAVFGATLRFAGIEPEAKRIARAVEHSGFDRLRAQEERSGFHEKPRTARFFFRAGRAGSWRRTLSKEQVRTITDAHAALMERFGYLREAEAFLRSGGEESRGALHVEPPS